MGLQRRRRNLSLNDVLSGVRQRLVRRARAAQVIVGLFERMTARQYRSGPIGKLEGRVIDYFLRVDPRTVAQRQPGVHRLIDDFFERCRDANIDLFIEIGAKEATASRRAVGELGVRAVAFEANPYTYARFSDDVKSAGVDYRHLAIANRAGSVSILVRLDEEGTPQADGQASLLHRPDHPSGYEEVDVAAVTLDDALDSMPGSPRRVALWVDVEGAVAEVVCGASRTLASADLAYVEVETTRRWDGQEWLANDVGKAFESRGMLPVGRDAEHRRQYNVLFARTPRLG